MKDVLSLLRPAALALKPDAAARSAAHAGAVLLDLNESPRPLLAGGGSVHRYPEPQPAALVARAAALYRAPRPSILITRGADEGIELLTRAACEAGRDRILVCPPSYGGYDTAAAVQGAGVVRVPLKGAPDFRLDAPAVAAAVRKARNRVKLVYICSPNNPTGTVFDPADIARVCRAAAGRALVVVDEAYLEFSAAPSFIARLREFPNLVVLRTLSKAWALAGLRCGFLFAAPVLVEVLQCLRAPYPLSSASLAVLAAMFDAAGERRMRRAVAGLLAEKDRLRAALEGLDGVELVFPGEANFLLIRVRDKERVLAAARRARVLVRDRSGDPGLSGCLRVTVGSRADNARFVSVLREAAR